jgi:hypothetical protein
LFKLVLPVAVILAVVYVAAGAWRVFKQRNAPRRRTWALFVGRSPRDRWLVRRVQRADPTAVVARYRLGRDDDLAARLGVTEVPTLVLGDGDGGVRARLVGRAAIADYLSRRAAR